MSDQEKASSPADDAQRRTHTHVFNPFQINENCFYVALGRVLSLDSATLASWVGNAEEATNNTGLDINGQQRVVDRLVELTRSKIEFINLAEARHLADRRMLHFGKLTVENLMTVIKKHGLTGRSFAISVDQRDATMGHYMVFQCTVAEEWDHETDQPVHTGSDTKHWKIEDFQLYHPCKDVEVKFTEGRVLQIIGRKEKSTIYGTSNEFNARFFDQNPIEGSTRALPTCQFDDQQQRWTFKTHHRGHWGSGYCIDQSQTKENVPQWRFRDHTPDDGSPWFHGEGFWQYKFGGSDWQRAIFTQCNTATGWGPPCIAPVWETQVEEASETSDGDQSTI